MDTGIFRFWEKTNAGIYVEPYRGFQSGQVHLFGCQNSF